MNEHRLIEQVLGSLETFASQVEQGLAWERRVLADYGAFFREFALRQVGEGLGPLTAGEARVVLENAGAFIPLLRAHIQKEDRILYPMAVRLLTGPEMDAMEAAFCPDPARMAAAAPMVG